MINELYIFRYKFLKLIVPLIVMAAIFIVVHDNRKERDFIGDELVVVCEPGHFGFVDDSISPKGLQYELISRFAKEQHVKLNIKTGIDFNRDFQLLKNGEIDMLIGNIPGFKSIRDEVLVSEPWFVSHMVLVQRKDQHLIKRAGDLDGKIIVLPSGSSYAIRLNNLSDEIAGTILIDHSENTLEEIMKDITTGRIAYSVCLRNQVPWCRSKYPALNFSLPLGFNQEFCWLIDSKRRILKVRLDDFMEKFKQTSEYKEILRKYY